VREQTFRILSLDGGGIRGAFTAAMLAELERQSGLKVADHFDLFAGTSTGGIIATALAFGESAQRIEEFYLVHGPAIFKRSGDWPPPYWLRLLVYAIRRWRGGAAGSLDAAWLVGPKYGAEPLRRALVEVFGDRTLEGAGQRLVVPGIDLAQGKTVVFKTPHLPNLVRDRDFAAVDVVLGTTAAPTYFPHAVIGEGSAYCDGGLWANNPSIVAYAEAVQIAQQCRRDGVDPRFGPEHIRMLSVGTGRAKYLVELPASGRSGLLFWGPSLIDVMGTSQSQGVGFLAKYLLGDERCTRVDFDIPGGSWPLDGIDRLQRLVHLGREAAIANVASLTAAFFQTPATRYVPFPRAAAHSGTGANRSA
jgi:predicted acylesterase/phospholipase RssA